MSPLKMADLGNQWEDLRKRARQQENEIDLKLVSFSKLGTSFSSQRDYGGMSSPNSSFSGRQDFYYKNDTTPLLNKSSSERMFETMATEIEQLLAKLTEINDRMSDYTQNLSVNSQSAALLHTLQRHRDILQDYSHEFQKTKANILAHKEREELLGNVRRDINDYKNASGMNRRTDLYLKENEHLRSSDRMVDEQINIAISTKENLQGQRSGLGVISQRINTLANKYPLINSLIQRVNIRKRRDSIILACVVAFCIILLLLYAFH